MQEDHVNLQAIQPQSILVLFVGDLMLFFLWSRGVFLLILISVPNERPRVSNSFLLSLLIAAVARSGSAEVFEDWMCFALHDYFEKPIREHSGPSNNAQNTN